MNIFIKLFKCLCLCVLIEKGSWSPNENRIKPIKYNKKQRAIVTKRLKSKKPKGKIAKAKKPQKPEWLKQWTISKGWMHNRSHLLSLGVSSENLVTETPTMSKKLQQNKENVCEDDNSSISIDNIDELLSVISDLENLGKNVSKFENESLSDDLDKIEVLSVEEEEINNTQTIRVPREKQDVSQIYSTVFENYRQNFPEIHCKTTSQGDIKLPEVYKERLLINKNANTNFFKELWNELGFKQKNKVNTNPKNFKFTINKLYNESEVTFRQTNYAQIYTGTYSQINEGPSEQQQKINNSFPYKSDDTDDSSQTKATAKGVKSSLGENIAMYNTLNSKTNLHEDTIYECSEDSISLYNNPIYVSSETYLNQDEKQFSNNFFDFHTNHSLKQNVFVKDRYNAALENYRLCHRRKFDPVKSRLKTEKYIIRHIKIRIMLSLRVNRIRRLYRKDARSGYRPLFRGHNRLRNSAPIEGSENVESVMRARIRSAHEEQRRIGNGKSSMKIQNMRYGTNILVRYLFSILHPMLKLSPYHFQFLSVTTYLICSYSVP